MSQNKACIVVTAFTAEQPGFLDFSYRIKSLAARYRLTVVSAFPLTQAELQLPNVNYMVINSAKGRLGWLSYLWRSASLIRQQRPDVAVLLHSMAAPVALLVGRIPTVTYWNEHPTHVAPDPHGFAPIKRLSRYLVRWMMFMGAKCSTVVMPIGEAHRDDLLAHGCNPEKTKMVYMGVDPSFAGVATSKSRATRNDPLALVYVGSIAKDRGRDVMLEAMSLVNSDQKIARLTIVGANAEQEQYCRDVIGKLGIEDTVRVHGRVPGHQIPEFMREADAGLCLWEDLPWYRYNPPTKLFEYLVAGLPVLASNIRTHTEYVQDGENGLIFEYGSSGLAEVIKRLWAHKDKLPDMANLTKASSTVYLWLNIEPVFLRAVDEVSSS